MTEFKIRKPGFYKLRNGEKYEVQCILKGDYPRPVVGLREGIIFTHSLNGVYCINHLFERYDIISEWVDEPEPEVQYINVYKNCFSDAYDDIEIAKKFCDCSDYKYTLKRTEWPDGKVEAEVIKL
jgi:hypothetical protein